MTGSLTAKNANGGTATFSGSLTGTIEAGDVLALSYHQPTGMSDYSAQAGTLASAAARDYAIAQVTVASVNAGEITISETSASFLTQTAMLKLTLQDNAKPTPNPLNATQLKVSAAMTIEIFSMSYPMTEDIATFNLAAATYTANGDGILYFALPDQAIVAGALVDKIKAKVPSIASMVTIDAVMTALNGATLTYTATVGSDTYTATKTNGYTFAPGKYYAGTLTMAKPAPTAYTLAESTVGMIVGSDGKAYAAADKDNLPSGVTAVAMVAYKSGSNGLAIALSDEGEMNWAAAKSTCEGKTAIGGNSWKLPSQDEWKQMFGANGGNNTKYTGLNTAITTAGGTALREHNYYWSSTPSGEDVRYVALWDGDAYWMNCGVDSDSRVRACLAF